MGRKDRYVDENRRSEAGRRQQLLLPHNENPETLPQTANRKRH